MVEVGGVPSKIMKLATQKTQLKQLRGGVGVLPARLLLLALSCVLLIVILLAVSFGSTPIPISSITKILLNGTGLFHFARHWDSTAELIVWQVRMPVVISAALVGAALSVAGVLFQGMLRNPLADPYLIGTSSGAALGAAIAFVLPFDTLYCSFFPLTPLLAFVGAMVTVMFVYAISRVGCQTPVVTLLLAGVVINAVLVAFQTLILTLSSDLQFPFQALFNWLSGGLAVTARSPIIIVACIVLVGFVVSLMLSTWVVAFGLACGG